MRLQQRQARETGICPVRRELYSQCFGRCYHSPYNYNVFCAWGYSHNVHGTFYAEDLPNLSYFVR